MSPTFEIITLIVLIVVLLSVGFFKSPRGTLKRFLSLNPAAKETRVWLVPVLLFILSKLVFVIFPHIVTSVEAEDLAVDIDDLMRLSPFWILPIVIVGGLIFPVLEEIIYRGFILNTFVGASRHFLISGIFIVNVLFALSHSSSFIDKFFSGVIYSYLRLLTGSLVLPIYLHMALNSVALIVMGILILAE